MKKIIIIVILILGSAQVQAGWGWNYRNISLLTGGTYKYDSYLTYSFELLYDRSLQTSGHKIYYHGASIVASINNEFRQFGVKGLFNPKGILLNYSGKFSPYFYYQANLKSPYKDKNSLWDLNNIAGIGMNSIHYLGRKRIRKLLFRTSILMGYTFDDKYAINHNGITFELKVGIGLNTTKFKKNNES